MEMAEEADGDGEGERKNPILAKNVVLLLRNLHISSGKCKAIPLWWETSFEAPSSEPQSHNMRRRVKELHNEDDPSANVGGQKHPVCQDCGKVFKAAEA
ncbi:unnamed protein product [Prunus armeniaca]